MAKKKAPRKKVSAQKAEKHVRKVDRDVRLSNVTKRSIRSRLTGK